MKGLDYVDRKYFLLPDNEPIFFADSFKLPLFNDIMEQELINALNWLKQQKLDDDLISCISRIIAEIIDINKRLLNKANFNSDSHYYCAEYYAPINPGIKSTKPCYTCNKQYVRTEAKECFYAIMRTITFCSYKKDLLYSDFIKYEFIYGFFLDLYADIYLFTKASE